MTHRKRNKTAAGFCAVVIGAAAGLVTLFVAPPAMEIAVWAGLIITIVVFAFLFCKARPILASGLIALIAGPSVTATHFVFLQDYLEARPAERAALVELAWFESVGMTLAALAPIYWLQLIVLTMSATAIVKITMARVRRQTVIN